jgi:hypothetical protein
MFDFSCQKTIIFGATLFGFLFLSYLTLVRAHFTISTKIISLGVVAWLVWA